MKRRDFSCDFYFRIFYSGLYASIIAVGVFIISVDQVIAAEARSKRVPAEWEPQAAIWLQWPGPNERVYEPAFATMAEVISRYQKLHILCNSPGRLRACKKERFRMRIWTQSNTNLTWHVDSQ